MSRASVRVHELAVRNSLGAGRARLIRQLVTEVLVLAAFGGAIGLGLGHLGLRWFTKQMFDVMTAVGGEELPFWIHFEFDYRVTLFVIGAALFSGVFAAIFPAIRASAAEAVEAMRGRGGGSRTLRMGKFSSGLVVTEIAVGCFLLISAGLMLKSVMHVAALDLGYSTGNIFTSQISIPDTTYPDAESRRNFYAELLLKLQAIPGVLSAAVSDGLPPYRSGAWAIEVEGQAYQTDEDYPVTRRGVITPDYFRIFETPIVHGRAFLVTDNSATLPVAVVNESFARKYLPDADIVGHRIRMGRRDAGAPWMTVVGVVSDLKALPLDLDGTGSEALLP